MLIRKAETSDAERIFELIREGYDLSKFETMIASCAGFSYFLKKQIETETSDNFYFVAELEKEIVALVELRTFIDKIFLNNINVSEKFRSKGVAKECLRKSIELLKSRFQKEMSLDVFSDNEIVYKWYKNLGFKEESRRRLFSLENNINKKAEIAIVSGIAGSCLNREQFGFSNFEITTRKEHYRIGALGDKWFRLSSVDILTDDDAMSALYKLDSKRKVLFSITGDMNFQLPPKSVFISESIRMNISLSELETNLNK